MALLRQALPLAEAQTQQIRAAVAAHEQRRADARVRRRGVDAEEESPAAVAVGGAGEVRLARAKPQGGVRGCAVCGQQTSVARNCGSCCTAAPKQPLQIKK